MLTLSFENDHRPGKIERTSARKNKKQNAASNLAVVSGPSCFGNAVADKHKANNWRAEDSGDCHRGEDEIENGGNHLFLSPVARMILAQHAEVVKLVEMLLLGAIVFCISFAVTAGL